MMDIDNVSAALEAAQRESLMSQQLAQRGTNNIMSGGTQLFQGFGMVRRFSMRLKPKSRLNWKLLKIRCSVLRVKRWPINLEKR